MRIERVIDFQNIVPGGVAIMKPALGPTYEAFYIALGGGLLITHMDRIQLKIDGKVVYETTGSDLLAQNLYDGLPNATNQIVIDFTQPNAKSSGTPKGPTSAAAEMLLTCLPSALFQMMTLEFTLNSSAPGGSTMVARAQVSEPSGNPYILKQQKAAYAFPATGDQYLPLPTGQSGALVKQIFMMQTNAGVGGAGSISAIEVRNNGVIITEVTPSDLALVQTKYGKVQQAGMTVLDYFLQGLRAKLLNTVAGVNTYLKLTTTGGPVNLTVYNRIIDPVNRK